MLAGARLFAGSSLHGRIVAMAHAIPRISLRPLRSSHLPSKHGAVIGTWDAALPAMVEPPQLGEGMAAALHADADGLRARAEDLPLRYRKGFEALCGKLDRALEIGQGG